MGLLTFSNFASKILVFLLVPLYTSVLTTEEYGTYDLIISTVNLLYPILTLNILDSVTRYLMDKDTSKNQVISISTKYLVASFFVVPVFVLIGGRFNLWANYKGIEILFVDYYCSYLLYQYLIQVAKGIEQVKDMAIAGVLATVTMLVSNIMVLLVFDMGLQGFLIAGILSQLIPGLYLVIRIGYVNYLFKWETNKLLEREMLLYCLPLIATTLGWYVNSTSDRYFVTFLCGISANGILSVSYKIPQILSTIQNIFIQAWQISALKEYGKKDSKKFYGDFFSVVNFFMVIACAGLIFLTRPLANLLFSKEFYAAWEYVPFLLLSSLMNCASGILGPILAAKKDSKSMALSAVYGASANVVLNYILIKGIGIQGAAIATFISGLIIYLVRRNGVKQDIVVDNVSLIWISWFLLFIQAIVEIYFQLWFVEIVIIIILLAMNHKQLQNLVSFLKKSCRSKLNG